MKSSALILPSTLGGVSLRFPLGSFPCLKFLPSHPLFCVWPPMRDYRLAMTLPNSTLHWDDRCKEQATPSTKSLHSHQTMVSQAWHCWHLGLDTSLLWGSVLCNVGCFSILDLYPPDASRMPPPQKKVITKYVSTHCQMSREDKIIPIWEPLHHTSKMQPQAFVSYRSRGGNILGNFSFGYT